MKSPRIFSFDNSYARLPEAFYARVQPTPVRDATLVAWNEELSAQLGAPATPLPEETRAAIFAGNVLPEGAEPVAQIYAGHQFGHFSPQLGDGRALLLGEVVDDEGVRRDVQLKGSGPTPFSRRGDGRAALGPVLREFLVSEAMHALGVPTTRALAAVTTGEIVQRERVLPGAVLTRVAASHLRVGSFELFASRGQQTEVAQLMDYAIERHDAELASREDRALALIEAVARRQAELIAKWMGVGFVHGVMNTDNSSISGETIDYGPCAFLDYYDPYASFSSIDRHGRYAFARQSQIAQWNLARLASSLLPQISDDEDEAVEAATQRVQEFGERFLEAFHTTMRAKLGLTTREDGDLQLIQDLLDAMHAGKADFTRCFRALAGCAEDGASAADFRQLFAEPDAVDAWLQAWSARCEREGVAPAARAASMRACNPVYIPRNHLVEEALTAAENGELGPFEHMRRLLAAPFTEVEGQERFARAGDTDQSEYQTFCGT